MSAERLLGLPVRVSGIELGRAVDVMLELEGRRAIGLEVRCRDETLRYLPLAAAHPGAEEIAIGSALVLLEERDLDWYRGRASSLRELRGSPVQVGGKPVGSLADVEVAADGSLLAALVETDGARRRIPFAEDVTIADRGSASAA